MRKLLLILLLPLLAGCFKDEPKLPDFSSDREININVDTVLCFSSLNTVEDYLFTCSFEADSMKWYGIRGADEDYLGTGEELVISVDPSLWTDIEVKIFTGPNSPYRARIPIINCNHHLYIPLAFTPDHDGINDVWSPIYAGFHVPYQVQWEVRTINGTKLHEATDFQNGWDGEHNGYPMPPGIYVYYIELTISGEDPVEYTGWLEILG